MPTASGSATSTADLLAQIDTFLTTNGWTRDKFVDNAGDGDEYYWNNGATVFVSTRQEADFIHIYPNTGFDTNAAVNAQPGMTLDGSWDDLSSPVSGTNNAEGQLSVMTGPYNGHDFYLDQRDGADYFVGVIEQTPGVYRWIGFGLAQRAGSPAIDGGEFVMTDGFTQIGATESRLVQQGGPLANNTGGGQDAAYCVRLNLDGVALDWYGNANSAPAGNLSESFVTSTNPFDLAATSIYADHFGYAYNTSGIEYEHVSAYAGLFPLIMAELWATRPLGNVSPDSVSPVARLPAMFYLNIKRLVPGQIYQIGGVDYKVYAEGRKVDHDQDGPGPNTQFFGVAMRADV